MKTIHLMISMFSLGTVVVNAETLRLADGSMLEGELGAPAEVTVKTAAGERRVPFSSLPADVQQRYWRKADETASAATTTPAQPVAPATPTAAGITADDLLALGGEVNLDTWEQVTAIGSFRDKPEKRGSGGLIVTKAFNAIEENWVTVYSAKDPVGQAGAWDAQVAKARQMQAQSAQFMQRRWLELFIKAGEAVSRRDSNEFALLVRELKRSPLTTASLETPRNFFTAK